MVFTIEPGLYSDTIGGFRHSDTVAVTPDGIDVLTEYPRDLESLTIRSGPKSAISMAACSSGVSTMPASARGDRTAYARSPMKPVTWGIVSTAHINRLVIPGAHASPKVELRAVASRERGRADAYAREWEIPVAYGSYEELLADPEIEALYISLPNTMHAEWSIKAVEAGKHVLCEKPFSRHPEEVEAAFDAAERAGRFLSEAFMWRHNPLAKELSVARGRAGRSASCGWCARRSPTRSTTRTTSGCGRKSRAGR